MLTLTSSRVVAKMEVYPVGVEVVGSFNHVVPGEHFGRDTGRLLMDDDQVWTNTLNLSYFLIF